jgi:hypothetical protein
MPSSQSDGLPLVERRTDPPGPPAPPFIPGHMGAPSYEACASMAALIGLFDVIGKPMPPGIAWGVGQWEGRIREWVKREVELGRMDELIRAAGRDGG